MAAEADAAVAVVIAAMVRGASAAAATFISLMFAPGFFSALFALYMKLCCGILVGPGRT
jgi:hypothetical protein